MFVSEVLPLSISITVGLSGGAQPWPKAQLETLGKTTEVIQQNTSAVGK